MYERLEILRMAQGLAAHTAARQSVVAGNVAHADTPGYRAQDIRSFAELYRSGSSINIHSTREGHITGGSSHGAMPTPFDIGGEASPNGNNVSLEAEMIRGVEVKRGHDMALAVYRSSLELLRTAIGRGR